MKEKIIIKEALVIFCVVIFCLIVTDVYAMVPPTCVVSFSPSTIKKGELSNWYFQVIGPVDKVVHKFDGVLTYMGDSTYDISSLPLDSLQYQDGEGFDGGYQIKPGRIGTGSVKIEVYGPGGYNSCSASIRVVEAQPSPATIQEGNDVVSQKEQISPTEENQVSKKGTQDKSIFLLSFFQNKNFQTSLIIILAFIVLLLSILLLRKKIKTVFQLKWSEINLQKIKLKPKRFSASIFIVIGIVISIGGISYGAVYHQTSKLVSEADQLTKVEKYNDAIEKLEIIQNKWLTKNLGIKKQEIANEIEKNKKLLEDESKYTQGIEEFNKGNWEKAKELLSKVSETSPYYKDTRDKIEEAQNKIIQKQIAEAVGKVTIEQEKSQEQIAGLQQKIKGLQQEQQSLSQPVISTSLPSSDINKIISSVVFIMCSGDKYGFYFNIGSGTTWTFSDASGYLIFTNAHIVSTIDGSYPFCMVSFPQLPSGNPYYIYKTEFYTMGYQNEIDWALLKLTTPYEPKYTLNQIPLFSNYPMCNFSDVNIGDKVTIFGYPTVGGNSITVTEGNISGFSGNNYKVSSGIIDKGNSGGAAILNKNKCSLGIPTWMSIGTASSVGIIQSWRTVYSDLSK